ncbi:MAG: carbohydrate ABC transporter permease [Nitrososphaerota archaeon]
MKEKLHILENIITYLLLAIALIFFTFPIIYFALISFKPEHDIWNLFSLNFTLENYRAVLFLGVHNESPYMIFYRPLINSIIISGIATLISLFVSLLTAYSITRFNYKGRENIAFFILTLYMVPPIVTFIPLWDIAFSLNLLDTHIFLIWCYTFFGIPLSTWLLRGFLVSIPVDIEESAMVDGCSRISVLLRITLPLLKPGLAATAILTFLLNWNEYLFASTFTSFNAITLPVTISKFGFWLVIDWTSMAAMSTLALLPVFILCFLAQRHIISGLTLGAVRQ